MDFLFGRDPLYNSMQVLLNLPDDDSDKSPSGAARSYVNDTKAMAGTAVDVLELPKAYVFVADMPGLKSSDVKVQIENGNVLVISGERNQSAKHGEDVKYLRVERRPTTFMRKFTLPSNANLDAIGASCADGVLTVTVPKVPPPEPNKPRTINVTVG